MKIVNITNIYRQRRSLHFKLPRWKPWEMWANCLRERFGKAHLHNSRTLCTPKFLAPLKKWTVINLSKSHYRYEFSRNILSHTAKDNISRNLGILHFLSNSTAVSQTDSCVKNPHPQTSRTNKIMPRYPRSIHARSSTTEGSRSSSATM